VLPQLLYRSFLAAVALCSALQLQHLRSLGLLLPFNIAVIATVADGL